MAKDTRPPFRSLRDLVLKELQQEQSLLFWNNDPFFVEATLEGILASEAYIIDQSARDYLDDLGANLTIEEYYQSIANTRMPFESVWIEAIFDIKDDGGETSFGALVTNEDNGIKVFPMFVLHGLKPWHPVYSGSEVVFHPDGNVSCCPTPIAKLYERISEEKGLTREDRLNSDIDKALRIGGLFALLCAALARPKLLERETVRSLSKSDAKAYAAAARKAPRFAPSVIRLSTTGRAERDTAHSARVTGGANRSTHWVRGHMFLARNGRLTWRRAHVRGSGDQSDRVHLVTK